MKESNKIDWSKAKKTDTHAISRQSGNFYFYEMTGENEQRRFDNDHNSFNCNILNNCKYKIVERPTQSVFTKEMQDDGKLPEVGMACMFKHGGQNLKGRVVAITERFIILVDSSGMERVRILAESPIAAIDNRTDKEKAIDEMYKEMNRRFNLPKSDDDYMCATDTQIGIEFLVEYMEIHDDKWVGKE